MGEYAYVPARAHASAAAPAPTAVPALSEAVYWAVTTPNGGSYCKKGDAPPAPVTVTAPDSRFWDAVPPTAAMTCGCSGIGRALENFFLPQSFPLCSFVMVD